jgi:GntR family transcriptional regulator
MDIEIDTDSAEPVFEQIVRQVRLGVQSGALAPGMALPPIRQLAHDLALNPNTVAKAYKLLENDLVIRSAGQKGTFINSDAAEHVDISNRKDATFLIANVMTTLVRKGLSKAQLQAAFQEALGRLEPQPGKAAA